MRFLNHISPFWQFYTKYNEKRYKKDIFPWHNNLINRKDGKTLEQRMAYRLLIVEDDCLIAEAAADYFTAKGWRV